MELQSNMHGIGSDIRGTGLGMKDYMDIYLCGQRIAD